MNETLETLGVQIRTRRRELGMRQEDLAKISGIKLRTVRSLEKGHSQVRSGDLVTVLAVLGLMLDVRTRSWSVQKKVTLPHR